MAIQFLSPSVFIEEVSSTVQTTQSVSASTAAFVGFTTQGPTGEARLVTSFDEYTRIFGDFSTESFMTHNAAAYFSNGGERAYILRIVPADAVSSTASIQSKTTNQWLGLDPDGATDNFIVNAATSVLKDNSGTTHIVPGSLSIKYRTAGTPVVTQDLRNRADSADVAQINGQANYEARINPASIPAFEEGLDSVVRLSAGGTVLTWDPDGGGNRTINIDFTGSPNDSSVVTTAANGQGSIVTLDHRTGFLSIAFAGTDIPNGSAVGDLRLSFTPASATITLTSSTTVQTDGHMEILGAQLTGGVTDNFVDVVDGSFELTFTGAATRPHRDARMLVTYKTSTWELTPVSAGAWGDNLRVQINGAVEFFTASTASYSRHNVFVLLKDRDGNYQLRETFEDLSFTDSTDSLYFADVINELSDLFNVNVLGGNEAPLQLHGVLRSQVIAGGNELAANREISATLSNPTVAKRTVSITYTNTSATARTITDDGEGNLTGDVDTTYATTVGGLGPNQIDYTTGAVNFKTVDAINGTSLVTVSYYTTAEETTHTEDFGDTTKDYTYVADSVTYSFYTAGSNGTFTSVNYGRNQFSNPTLRTSFGGIYALDKIEEILQLCVPDFAGDVSITRDLLDYADLRAAEPQGGDRFIILTTPVGYTSQQASDWFRFSLLQSSNYAAIYWPWVKVKDPLANNRPITVPPLGHVAGVYARTDASKNVGKAPGGTIDGKLNYLIGLESVPSLADRNLVYQNKINPFISTNVDGTCVWGVQTIAQDSRWRLINARRLFMYVEKNVFSLTQWAIFENNGPALWAKLRAQLIGFLTELYNQGYLAGNNPSEAFRVVIDTSNNNQATIDAGQLYIDIALKPFKSVEFLVARFSVLVTA